MLRESDEDPEESNENFIGASLDSTLSFLLGGDVDVMGDSPYSINYSTFSECTTAATSSDVSAFPTVNNARPTEKSSIISFMPQPQQMKADYLLPHQWNSLTAVIRRGKLVKVDLTQLGITADYAHVIHLTLVSNPLLQILKLGYNDLRDDGVSILAPGITSHPSLKVLDIGFNSIGDVGCRTLSKSLNGNFVLETLYLTGNSIAEQGVAALSQTLTKGCGVLQLYLTANKIGPRGIMHLAQSIVQSSNWSSSCTHQPTGRPYREKTTNVTAVVSSCDSSVVATSSAGGGSGGSTTSDPDESVAAPLKSDLLCSCNDIKACNIRELYLGDTSMTSEGCLYIAKMLLTNSSLRALSLPNNNLSDCDAILLSQSISRNKMHLPLEMIHLSFNRLTCVGVEALMNAVWGSQTLREIKLDSNYIKDRGAQLVAVVLTSVPIELLDIGFNRIGAVGIKALMKNLSENRTVRSLTLSGNIIDTTSARAVSYALALNQSLEELFMDNCSATYGAQRHIAAGIVSNKFSPLRVLRGFHLGAIITTLGFPAPVENWSNDQLLKFMSLMWQEFQVESASLIEDTNSSTSSLSGGSRNEITIREIADPKVVIKVANRLFERMNDPSGISLLQALDDTDTLNNRPTIPGSGAVIMEISESGSLVVPEEIGFLRSQNEPSPGAKVHGFGTFLPNPQSSCTLEQKRKLAPYLQVHCDALDGLAKKPFNKSEMWKLRRIYSSPVDYPDAHTTENDSKGKTWNALSFTGTEEDTSPFQHGNVTHGINNPTIGLESTSRAHSVPSTIYKKSKSQLYRKPSYRCLNVVTELNVDDPSQIEGHSKESQSIFWRHSFTEVERGDGESLVSNKRARGNKLRIDSYPRIKMKLEEFKKQKNELCSLVLMRQLLYIEQQNMHAYTENNFEGKNMLQLTTDDIEALLLDLL